MKKIIKYLKNNEAFTLLEMAIVLFIISALLLIIIPNIGNHQDTAEETGNEALEVTIQAQADLYEVQNEDTATLESLLAAEYLTQSQFDQAVSANITIE